MPALIRGADRAGLKIVLVLTSKCPNCICAMHFYAWDAYRYLSLPYRMFPSQLHDGVRSLVVSRMLGRAYRAQSTVKCEGLSLFHAGVRDRVCSHEAEGWLFSQLLGFAISQPFHAESAVYREPACAVWMSGNSGIILKKGKCLLVFGLLGFAFLAERSGSCGPSCGFVSSRSAGSFG